MPGLIVANWVKTHRNQLNLRPDDERVGPIAERLETTEKAKEIQRQMLEDAGCRPRNRDELVDRLCDGRF